MEEKIIRKLNWYYYGVMVFTLIILSAMYYLTSQPDFEPYSPNGTLGMTIQYTVILLALIGIPAGLYAVKFFKPDTYEKYESAAAFRIMVVGLIMPLAICAFYLFGGYKPMMWIAAMAAVSWLFTKPTLGKMEQEMKPQEPNEETY